nr:DUF58 domain-containing protein [uncultured Desulfobacter sp.]
MVGLGPVKKLKEMLSQPVSLKRRRVPGKIRMGVTPSGLGFAGLILCGFLMSVNFSNNLIFAMTFLLVSIAMVGLYFTRTNIRAISLSDWHTEPVFAGQDAIYRITADNGPGHARHGLTPKSVRGSHGKEVHLPKGVRTELLLARPAKQRGMLPPVPADVRSCFPLGIFSAKMTTTQLPECLVFPKPQGEQPMPDHASAANAHLMAESGTWTDMRRYAPGDPLSRIDWRAMARFDELYTKEFDGGQGKPALWFAWDDVRANGVEPRLSQLCQWVVEAGKQNREYGLKLPGTTIGPGSDTAHHLACLSALALYGKTPSDKSSGGKKEKINERI